MKTRTSIYLSLLLSASLTSPLCPAALADWLYFPMYERDTAHAVHWSALKFREDGLLSVATRYPRHPGEPWTEEESRYGWYNYEKSLVDCQTGFTITLREELLGQTGDVLAHREDPQKILEDWKADLPSQLQSHKWPNNYSTFLACASVKDAELKRSRQQLVQQNQTLISYTPMIEPLKRDSDRMAGKRLLRFDLDALKKSHPTNPEAALKILQQQYQNWRSSFSGSFSMPTPAAQTSFPELNAELLQWVNTSHRITDISSKPDGTIRFTKPSARVDDFAGEVPERPKAAEMAEDAALVISADCNSGLYAPVRLDWLDTDKKILAKQNLTTEHFFAEKERLTNSTDGEERSALFPYSYREDVFAVCRATAAQCLGKKPDESSTPLLSFIRGDGETVEERNQLSAEKMASVLTAPSPEAALLAMRALWQAEMANYIPNCQIGKTE